jgi:vacuolar-type H+-ATPase subunit I/STV1
MKDPALFRRTAAALGLVGAVITSAIWTFLEPEFPSDPVERLAAIDEGGAGAAVSAACFAFSQLFMLAAVLGIAHLIRRGAPLLSNLGASLSVVGVLGHAVFAGSMLMTVTMAADAANREVHAGVVEDFESSPMMAFAAAGLLGTVLGILLLSIGLWRSGAAPRWIPALLWAFLVVEFVGTALSDYATYAALLCLGLAFAGLAKLVWQTPRTDWETLTAPSRSGDLAVPQHV